MIAFPSFRRSSESTRSTSRWRASKFKVKYKLRKETMCACECKIAGSPQTLVVEEAGKPRAYGAAFDKAVQVGQVASLTFDSKKTKGGLKVEVKGINTLSASCVLMQLFAYIQARRTKLSTRPARRTTAFSKSLSRLRKSVTIRWPSRGTISQ